MTPILKDAGSTRLTQNSVLPLIKKWQKKLNLSHWQFGISTSLPQEHHDMEIVMTPIKQHAAIRINPKCYSYTKSKFEKLIIHEMLHPLFEPVEEEFDRAAGADSFETRHFNKAIETTVDHLANVIYNLST